MALMTDREREVVDALGPEAWEKLRAAVKAAFADMKPLPIKTDETPRTLTVRRMHAGQAIKVLALVYDERVPRIRWRCCDPEESTGDVRFMLHNTKLFYTVNDINTPLNEIVTVLTSCMTS